MANFRIDSLDFVRDSTTNKYSLTGWCNINASNLASPIIGTQVDMDLNFVGIGDISDKKFSFSIPELDFSMFPELTYDMLNLNFIDDLVSKPKRGGILIKDTKYPPPDSFLAIPKHKGFTQQFTIESIRCKDRNLISGSFDVKIELSYSSLVASYLADSLYLQTDTVRDFQKLMNLKVGENFDGASHQSPPNSPLEFNERVDLGKATGVPLIVVNKNIVWNLDIDYKKANIFIK